MGMSVIDHDMRYVDYVCFVCHLLNTLPKNAQQQIYSARLKVFPHDSATELLTFKGSHQITRMSLLVLYKSPEPPASLVHMLEELSQTMVRDYYMSLAERGKKTGSHIGGLEKLAEKMGSMKMLRLFFSFDENALHALARHTSPQSAVRSPDTRKALQTALMKLSTVENVQIERLDKTQPLSNIRKASALCIALNNEVFGFTAFEDALRTYLDKHLPKQDVLRNHLLWPKSSPGPLPRHKFMDRMSIAGLKDPFEARYARIKGLNTESQIRG